MKLGEALVKEGIITRQQLNQALERQVVYGGRIGTNLVELRFISEEELTRFLGRFFNITPVKQEMLASIPSDVIESLSPEIANKYKIIPFKKDRNRLHTAMLNPRDIKEIDEIRFITGFDVIPYVITELRLLHCLEKYYGIKRDVRYVSLTDRFNPEERVEESTIENIKRAFADVKETEEIAGILLQEVYKVAERVAIFAVREGKVTGWKARGLAVEGFRISEPDKEMSVFSDVLRNKTYYRGPILNIRGNEELIRLLSGTPQDSLLIPIGIRDKTVALLYVDNGNSSVLNANVGYLSRLATMAGVAFEIMILRKKLLDL